jgi:hypothetical protein
LFTRMIRMFLMTVAAIGALGFSTSLNSTVLVAVSARHGYSTQSSDTDECSCAREARHAARDTARLQQQSGLSQISAERIAAPLHYASLGVASLNEFEVRGGGGRGERERERSV